MDVRLLGPLQVVDRSGESIEVPGELPPTPVSSDRIVDALWDEQPPDSPEASLHSTVSRLRHALGKDIIKRVPDSYLLEIQVASSDLARLRRDISIACQYVGTLPTAKGYGSLPLYALHQKV
ncbi:MAG: hypothetical protein WD651_13570 [Acidimicrobiia bacterium]